MPNAASLAAISQAQLIRTVDDGATAANPFKLPAFLRTKLDADFAALEAADNDTALTESDRAGGSAVAREALTKLDALLRDGYNGIKAIPGRKITAPERLEVFTTYGWSGGKLGTFNDARVIGLSRLGVRDDVGVKAEWKYSAELVEDLKAQLKIYDNNAAPATGADRVKATRKRDEAQGAMETTLLRVRCYYCCASDDADQTPELTKIGFQPRRAPGTGTTGQPAPAPSPNSKPATPVPATPQLQPTV